LSVSITRDDGKLTHPRTEMPQRRQRATKPSLNRSKPIRSWSKAFGGASAAKSAKPAKSAKSAKSAETAKSGKAANGTVADGVRLGYRVIDDYLKKGQEAAQTLGGAGGDTLKAASTEVQRLTQRMFQYASDLASAWMELVQTMTATGLAADGASTKNGVPPPAARGEQAPAPGREPASDPSDQPCAVSLEIESLLRRRAIDQPVEVQPLSSNVLGAPQITGVSIEARPKAGRVLVRVRVPPTQSAGVYRGLIIDRNTNLPCGTLAIRVGPGGTTSA
jgi:hypothetical protein